MNYLPNRNTGARRAVQTLPTAMLALLLLLCALSLTPVQAQDSAGRPLAVATVNINTADASALAAGLNGIGTSRAEDIVRYREEFGPFTTVEQLTEVKGVGASTLEKNRARITLE